MIEFDNLTYLHGKPQGTGLLKANPEDFVVVEDCLLYTSPSPRD